MRSTSVCAYVTARATSGFRRRGTTAPPPTTMDARKILAGVLEPKSKYRRKTQARALENLPTGDFYLSGAGAASSTARPPHSSHPTPTLDEPSRGTPPKEQASKQTDAAKEGNSSPSRPGLLPGAGRRRMTRRRFSGENAKILRRGGWGRRHDLAAADGLWERIGPFVSYCAAGWARYGITDKVSWPCFDHRTAPCIARPPPGCWPFRASGETADGSRW